MPSFLALPWSCSSHLLQHLQTSGLQVSSWHLGSPSKVSLRPHELKPFWPNSVPKARMRCGSHHSHCLGLAPPSKFLVQVDVLEQVRSAQAQPWPTAQDSAPAQTQQEAQAQQEGVWLLKAQPLVARLPKPRQMKLLPGSLRSCAAQQILQGFFLWREQGQRWGCVAKCVPSTMGHQASYHLFLMSLQDMALEW